MVLVMAWAIVLVTGVQGGLASISVKSWVFLVLSGLVTGVSWLCYYRALQLGQASLVVPIDKLSLVITLVLAVVLLREQLTARGVVGAVLVTVGAIVMVT